jgi:hypothetical protein
MRPSMACVLEVPGRKHQRVLLPNGSIVKGRPECCESSF